MKRLITLLLVIAANGYSTFAQQSPITVKKSPTRHGPEKGSLIIIGGNVGSQRDIWDKFTELAGGKDKAVVVVVTTAAGDSAGFDNKEVDELKKQTGITNVTLLHPSDLATANTEKFTAP